MGAFTGEAKNEQMKKAGELAKFVGVGGSTTISPEASAAGSKFKKTAHGLANGTILVPTSLSGGAGLVSGRVYRVVNATANEFELSVTSGGAAESWTTTLEAASVFAVITEHTGAKTKRKATSFGAPSKGVVVDSTAHEIEMSGTVTVRWALYFTEETAGTLIAVSEVTEKPLSEADIYRLTEGKLEENGLA